MARPADDGIVAGVPERLTRLLRRAGVLVCSGALAVAAVLGPASPAQAVLPSGIGWSGSWNYYTNTALQYETTLPGVRLTGYGTDGNLGRAIGGVLEDTSIDGRCARVQIIAQNSAGARSILDENVCDGGAGVEFARFGAGRTIIITSRTRVDGSTDQSHPVLIPDYLDDPGLQTAGTGYRWSYQRPDAFEYTVTRPGVKLSGSGVHRSGLKDGRSVVSAVEKTESRSGCATGKLWDSTTGTVSGSACGVMGSGTSIFSPAQNFDGWIAAEACWEKCLAIQIPQPR